MGLGLGSAIMLDPKALLVSSLADRDSLVHTTIWTLVYEMMWMKVVGPIKILWPVSAKTSIGSNISIEMVDKAN